MNILTVLTYYRPHTSGLTIYAERLSKAFARRGHRVTVLTSQFDPKLPRVEEQDGVRIVRVPVLLRVSKGVIMPGFGFTANKLVRDADVILLHLPQFDAAGVALRGRLLKKPTVVTYHCDLFMPPGLMSWIAMKAIHTMNDLAAKFTHGIVTYTRDYGENSPYLRRNLKKLHVIPPPVDLPEATPASIDQFTKENNPHHRQPVIGMAARFASEKGVDVLLNALPIVLKKYPSAMVLYAGAYKNILGEEAYWKRLSPIIQGYIEQGAWKFVGNLNPEQMAAFYPNLDVFLVPSLNSTESFGLVQIEAMMNGVPCIASDLPGVRQPVIMHQMGKIVPIGDGTALGEAICEIIENPHSQKNNLEEIRRKYLPDTIAAKYEELFGHLARSLG